MEITGKIKVVKSLIRRLEKTVREFPTLDKSLKDSETYLLLSIKELTADYETVTNYDHEIIADGDEDDLAVKVYFDESLFEKFKTLYMKHSTLLHDLHKIAVNHNPPNNCTMNDSSANLTFSRTSTDLNVTLPAIKIEPFDGKYEKWADFEDDFETNIHNNPTISNSVKLRLLQSFLKGHALKVIRRDREQLRPENYQTIWESLKKRYSHKRSLVYSYFQSLFFQEVHEKENSTNLQKLLDTSLDAISALKNLGLETDNWGDMLIFIIHSKLSVQTKELWDSKLDTNGDLPNYADFISFLEDRYRSLESRELTRKQHFANFNPKPVILKTTLHTSQTTKQIKDNKAVSSNQCKLCSKGKHVLRLCESFIALSLQDRINAVRKLGFCFNCFGYSHRLNECKSSYRCATCGKKHHTMIHEDNLVSKEKSGKPININSLSSDTTEANSVHTYLTKCDSSVIFPTALVNVSNQNGYTIKLRAIIDSCSDASYITKSAARKLQLPRFTSAVKTSGLGDVATASPQYITKFRLSSVIEPSFCKTVNAYILPNISSQRPRANFSLDLPKINNIQLADPAFNKIGDIDMLLGGDIDSLIQKEGIIRSIQENIVFRETKLGWVVSGSIRNNQCFTVNVEDSQNSLEKLDKTLRSFWELEEIPNNKILTSDEQSAEEFYNSTTQRLPDGKYMVNLPFKNHIAEFADMRRIAMNRFMSLERKLNANTTLKDQYSNCLKEYVELGHMSLIRSNQFATGYYLPHHCVIKESSSTTKLRVVFDASCKDSNLISLNENLLNGPRLQVDLLDLLLKFRTFRFALTADIEKMYRQILVNPIDHKYQLLLWRTDPKLEISTYVLKTVTFGTTPAPYLAVKTLHRLADDEEKHFPIGAECLKNGFYVDDFIHGADTIAEAHEKQSQTIQILKSGGFNLRKWSSNCEDLLETVPEEDRETKTLLTFDDKSAIKTLGINWSPCSDTFSYNVKLDDHKKHTKRSVLSDVSKIFDPLGWISPTIVLAKLFIQLLWLKQSDWDTPLSAELLEQWCMLRDQLPLLSNITLPRWLGTLQTNSVEIHGFADASEKAYAAVIYVRTMSSNKIELIISKTKVAPLKKVTLPRLELNAAVLLAKLMQHIIQTLQFKNSKCFYWSDSMITLAWIRDNPHKRTTYVANRVAEIQSVSNPNSWYHVKSADNPADLGSRGILPHDLKNNELWWHGPQFLKNFDLSEYQINLSDISLPKEENKKILNPKNSSATILSTFLTERKISLIEVSSNIAKFEFQNKLMNKFSTLSKLVRVVAYCKRVIPKYRKEQLFVNPEEYQSALTTILLVVQNECFEDEIRFLVAKKCLSKSSMIYGLSPMIDIRDSLLRINSRLGKADHLSYDQKFPILLPYDHFLSTLIVRHAHLQTMHGTVQQTWMFVIQKYHIIRCKVLVKKIIFNCIKCHRFRCSTQEQQMAQLPSTRVSPSRAFQHCGVDLAGPFEIKKWKGKCNKFYKAYFAIFICFSTKAVHLEVVVDLSSQEFIAAYRRFIARRGIPITLHSDCGRNFVGAESIVTRKRSQYVIKWNEEMGKSLSEFQTKWIFNPPSSPHFGGLWEAGVKSAKHHLKRVLGNAKLSYDEFETILLQVESCMNSRPLCKLDGNPDSVVLTPGHFLIQTQLNTLPENNYSEKNVLHLDRWNYVQKLFQQFWKTWSGEYLNTLRQRQKWHKEVTNIKLDDIVLIKENNTPPNSWCLGKVIKVHYGTDRLVRVVTVKTENSIFDRPIVKLCPLPMDS